jgi:uncharacterized protein with von Willebrand factor type A (vWA) domain
MHEAPATPAPMVDRLVRLARALHARGLDVALSDTLDAAAAVTHLQLGELDVARREELRACLRATLVKGPDPRGHFDELFERLFAPAIRVTHAADHRRDLSKEAVLDTLVAGDLTELAAALVETHAGFDSGETRSEQHHVHRVLRAADLARLMMLALRDRDDTEPAALRARVEELKRLIAAEVRARTDPGDDLGQGPTDIERIDFLHASRVQLDQMREAVRPLARRVATRLARRRQRSRSGRVDIRRTLRRSLASGGVPIDLAQRRRRPHRPELFVLCDISGSVAEFSVFTLTLMAALSAELPRTRSFVFVDAIDEVTGLLDQTGHEIEPWQLLRNTNVIGETGHSDYGAVFEQFLARVGPDLSSTATVLVTGDARSNYRPAGATRLGELARACRSIVWFDPEPRDQWEQHDSALADYRPHCSAVFEVRTLTQLEAAIERIL